MSPTAAGMAAALHLLTALALWWVSPLKHIDISDQHSKSVDEFADQNFDYVLTVAVAALALGFLAYRHVTEEPPRVLKMFVRAASGQGGVSGEQSSSRFAGWTQAGFRRYARRQRSALGSAT